MSDDNAITKKPSKRERLEIKRAERAKVMNQPMTMPVTLECPSCHVQQKMTLDEYFDKIHMDSIFKKILKCEFCPAHSELMFYKVDMHKVMAAGLTYERKRRNVSVEDMNAKIEYIENGAPKPDQIEEHK